MGPRGFEPLTFSMSRKRSNQLSYEPEILIQLTNSEHTSNQFAYAHFVGYGGPAVARECEGGLSYEPAIILFFKMGREGVEPSRSCEREILSLHCLPFQHLPGILPKLQSL